MWLSKKVIWELHLRFLGKSGTMSSHEIVPCCPPLQVTVDINIERLQLTQTSFACQNLRCSHMFLRGTGKQVLVYGVTKFRAS